MLECVVDIHTRRKLIRTMPANRDRPINRAMVVGCAVSATRNHLKLHEPRKLKVLFSNIHAKTRKLWKHPAMRLAASRTNAAHQSTNRPLTSSVCPPRCPLHSSGLTCRRTSRRAGVPPIIETTERSGSVLVFGRRQPANNGVRLHDHQRIAKMFGNNR